MASFKQPETMALKFEDLNLPSDLVKVRYRLLHSLGGHPLLASVETLSLRVCRFYWRTWTERTSKARGWSTRHGARPSQRS
jgi:hypothetical protein